MSEIRFEEQVDIVLGETWEQSLNRWWPENGWIYPGKDDLFVRVWDFFCILHQHQINVNHSYYKERLQ